MNATDYQREAARTLIDAPDQPFTPAELHVIIGTLKIAVAAGKAAEYVKKAICHRHGYDHTKLIDLLADVNSAMFDLAYFNGGAEELVFSGNEQMMLWCALGLAGEAGEVCEAVGFDTFDRDVIGKEIGDCEWYAAALCTLTNQSLGSIMQSNIDKLKRRYPNGYNSADSQARVDQQPAITIAACDLEDPQIAADLAEIASWDQWTDEEMRRQ